MKKLLLIFGILVALPCAVIMGQDTTFYKNVNLMVIDPAGTPPVPVPGCSLCIGNIVVDATTGVMTITYSNGTKYVSPPLKGPKGDPGLASTVPGPKGDKGDPGVCPICPPSTGGGGGSKTPEYSPLDYGASGSDNNDDTQAFQSAITAAINGRGKLIIPAAANRWFLSSTLMAVPPSGQGQIYFDVEAFGPPGNIVWRGTSNKAVIHVEGLKNSHWSGLSVEVPTGITNVQVIDVDTSPAAQSTSFVKFENFYFNANGTDVVGIRFGYGSSDNTSGGGADISDYTIENLWFFGTRLQGQYAVQSLGRNTLAMQIRDPFVAFAHSVFSNIGIGLGAQQARGNGSWYMYGVNTSQNLCEFRFNREGTYVVDGGRMEASDKLLDTSFGSHTQQVTFIALRINDFKGNGTLVELNSPTNLTFIGCHIDRQTNDTFANMITLNGGGGFASIMLDNTSLRADNIVSKVGGSTQWKLYVRGCTKWKIQSPHGAVVTESFIPDVSGQLF